jgi:hypothetical protein
MKRTLVSIVVCTHNRAAMLANALASLADLHTNGQLEYEVVVVDNASTDSTPATVEAFRAATKHTVQYVPEPRKGIAFARNTHWLWQLWAFTEDRKVLGAGGTVLLELPADCRRALHPFVRMLLGEARHGNEPFPYSHRCTFGTGNLLLHRVLFERVGKFDETFTTRAEDTDLFCRIHAANIATWYVPAAIVHHITPYERLEPAYLNRLARQMGISIAQRELAHFGSACFAARWLAKGARYFAWQIPRQHLASACGRNEEALGRACQNVLAHAYYAEGRGLLRAALRAAWERSGPRWLKRGWGFPLQTTQLKV